MRLFQVNGKALQDGSQASLLFIIFVLLMFFLSVEVVEERTLDMKWWRNTGHSFWAPVSLFLCPSREKSESFILSDLLYRSDVCGPFVWRAFWTCEGSFVPELTALISQM